MSDTYDIAFTAPARRALRRLPEKVATAVVEFLYGSLAANPHRVGKPLQLQLAGLHSARRGDYRVIYRIDADNYRVEAVAVEYRADVYRSRGRIGSVVETVVGHDYTSLHGE